MRLLNCGLRANRLAPTSRYAHGATLRAGRLEKKREPDLPTVTPEHWRAWTGVTVCEGLGMLSAVVGLYEMFRDGRISAGMGFVSLWPLMKMITKKEKQ